MKMAFPTQSYLLLSNDLWISAVCYQLYCLMSFGKVPIGTFPETAKVVQQPYP